MLLTGVLALTVPQAALALTAACTKITNQATVTYDVGTVPQAAITSKNGNTGLNEATYFYVGAKVDFTLTRTDVSAVTVVPNAIDQDLSYTLTNNSNATLQFALSYSAKVDDTVDPFATGLLDKFDARAPTTPAVVSLPSLFYSAGLHASGSLTTLAPTDPPLSIKIRGSVPPTALNDTQAVYALIAQAKWMDGTDITTEAATAGNVIGTAGVNPACFNMVPNTTTVEVVLNDPAGDEVGDTARDGKASKRNAYKVVTAGLSIVKSSAVTWDPVNHFGLAPGETAPKAIPGAVVTYTIVITNNGAVNATNVLLTDDLSTQMGNLDFGNVNAGNNYLLGAVDCTGGAAKSVVLDGVCKTNAYGAPDDEVSWSDVGDPNGALSKLVVTNLTVNSGGGTKTIKYQVTIKQ